MLTTILQSPQDCCAPAFLRSSQNDLVHQQLRPEVPMVFAQSPQRVEQDWLPTDEISSRSGPRNLDARFDERIGLSTRRASVRSHSVGLRNDQAANDRSSIGGRILRRLTRFCIAVLIGVGATLGWQVYGDAAREMFAARAPTLAWLFPVSATKPPVVAATPPASAQ